MNQITAKPPTSHLTGGNAQLISLFRKRLTFFPSEIVYLESDSNYTIFHLRSGKQYISSFTLKHHIDQFKEVPFFYRVSRAIFVNLHFVGHTTDDSIVLKNGKKILVSRRRQKDLESLLKVLA